MTLNLKTYSLCIISLVLATVYVYAQQAPYERHFDEDFKERYSSDRYNYEGRNAAVPQSTGEAEYADYDSDYSPTVQDDSSSSESVSFDLGPFTWLFYLALAAGVIYLIYFLLNEGGSGLFSSRQNQTLNRHQPITADTIENTDLKSLIANAENSNDFRLAIRYHYLLILKTLSLKNIIQFEDDKTNAEYIRELESQPYSNGFKNTSYVYNYVWYGEFPLNPDLYSKAKLKFESLLKEVK